MVLGFIGGAIIVLLLILLFRGNQSAPAVSQQPGAPVTASVARQEAVTTALPVRTSAATPQPAPTAPAPGPDSAWHSARGG